MMDLSQKIGVGDRLQGWISLCSAITEEMLCIADRKTLSVCSSQPKNDFSVIEYSFFCSRPLFRLYISVRHADYPLLLAVPFRYWKRVYSHVELPPCAERLLYKSHEN